MTRASIHIDDSELRNLYVDLRGAPLRVQNNTRETLVRSARAVNDEMREDARGHRYLKHLPRAVSYQLIDRYTAEIGLGPQRGTQGSLAHIIVYGSVNNAPVYDHTAGLRRAEPRILEWFADEAEDSVLGGEK